MQYSLSYQVIKTFNNTKRDIYHNELVLRSKIVQLHQILRKYANQQDTLFAKDIYNQLVILYNALLDTFRDIENSITFCKINTMHPSIIISPINLLLI